MTGRTVCIRLGVPDPHKDLLVAALADLGFDGFEEEPGGLKAYAAESRCDDETAALVEREAGRVGARVEGMTTIEARNWNAEWEATVRPVVAGRFCVHPPWARPIPGYIPVCIEPRMSFGTGHHESTRLMLESVSRLVRPGDRVLDAGTGSGVLALAALALGAGHAEAIDVDPWAVSNAVDNARANGAGDRMDVRPGGVERAGPGPFDVVLANLNRGVLLDVLPELAQRLAGGGRMAIAGILRADQELMEGALRACGLDPSGAAEEGDWIALTATRG